MLITSIKTKISALWSIRKSIRAAIIDRNVTVPHVIPWTQYADRIALIESGSGEQRWIYPVEVDSRWTKAINTKLVVGRTIAPLIDIVEVQTI